LISFGKRRIRKFQKILSEILITISLFLTATAVFPYEKGFLVTIPQATMPPKVDGVGKDVIWQFTPELTVNDLPVFEG